MINGAHVIVYSQDADADRAFLRDILGAKSVDAGGGWLILQLPPAEVAVHPGEAPKHELYFMCDDIEATIAALTEQGVRFTTPVSDQGWGKLTTIRLPGGGEVGLYEPRHPIAYDL
ncbi:VOC family protein [Kribbella sp. NPDC026611]|uniref:VOC family protein n=1 Tax=Kribbella sp. NPDC026611 TaxID=3154911 RepID=UPI0033E7A4F5